jgi:hypothetical protein
MGTDIATLTNTGMKMSDLNLKSFYGGNDFGEMLQISQGLGSIINNDEPGFIQLTAADTYHLIIALTKWLKDSSHRKAEKIQKEIDKNKELKRTIFEEIVNCEKYISDLEIIKYPLYLLGK